MKSLACILPTLVLLSLLSCKKEKIDFSSQVKPILNKRCISCHGGVKRNADFSLLFRHEALDTTESGKPAIIPGDPEHSEFMRRITSDDPEFRMPYKEEPLTAGEVKILKQWIQEGAEWGDHWAYTAPKQVHVPTSDQKARLSDATDWAKNEIDWFVLEKLEEKGLSPSPEADKATLVRRVYLDIIGLPPTREQAEAFINDNSDDAYEKLVDSLLASKHFGEKWASWWLDMARYADTKGYEKDVGREIWRYRDWVINAFNKDLPFDQFTIEQLAGDLLSDPGDDQLIATAFHRNTMNNDEGGTDDEEFRVAALIDRVNTTYEIWQSTTMGCVQCHTHPYDPFLHEEYYTSMAFFNNTRDEDTPGEHPVLRFYEADDAKKLEEIKVWAKNSGGDEAAARVDKFLRTFEPKYHPHAFDQLVDGALLDNKWLGIQSGGSARLPQINMDGKRHILLNYWTSDTGGTFEIRLDSPDGKRLAQGAITKTDNKIFHSIAPVSGVHDLYFIFRNPSISPLKAVCSVEWIAFLQDLPDKNSAHSQRVVKLFSDLVNVSAEGVPIMVENTDEQKRSTHVFERGNWMVNGKEVTPDVPKFLNAYPEGEERNRLGFARWLVSKENPLTARATVNRFWEQLFGVGIVETLEDFGTQGALPTHPEMLDWLALQFMNEYQWSMKRLIKTMVMSATYRQDSRSNETLLAADPDNQWLARGPRVRLSAEQIRDQALAVSGLLSKKMGGKSVMPYQPAGVWNSVYSGEYWKQSEGEDQYRRSVYTYIKRTSTYPSMVMFDGSTREVCVSRRIRTNTPLQALVTLNDSSFVVAAQHFATYMKKMGDNPGMQISEGYKTLMVRDIAPQKLDVLMRLYERAFSMKAANVVPTGNKENEIASPLDPLAVVATAMLNLDEALTKE